MRLTKRQAEAVNEIIQEEVQDALGGRALIAEHLRRGKLLEEAVGQQLEQARAKVEEAAMLLSEARTLLEDDHKLHTVAEEAFEAAYGLMGQLDDAMTSGDEMPDTERGGGYPGGGGDVDLPPMHPRGR
jgi:hypothetical protein